MTRTLRPGSQAEVAGADARREVSRRAFLGALVGLGLMPRGLGGSPLDVGAGEGAGRLAGIRPSSAGWTDGVGAPGDLYALVLGTVQDAGFPQVGCYTPLCDEGRRLHAAGHGRYVASLALVEPRAERFYLVDATPDITRQIDLIEEPAFRERAAQRRPFDGIFLTHAHIGHYTGLAVLGNEGLGIRDTPVYCTPAMAEFLAGNQPWAFLVEQGRVVLNPLVPGAWHRIDEHLEVQLWQVPHRNEFADTVAFVFRGAGGSLLYLPDINRWEDWSRDAAAAVASVDVALVDGSFWSLDELPGRLVSEVPHPLIRRSMDRFQDVVSSGDAKVVFTHLNNSNPALREGGPEARSVEERGFALAREGMRFEL